MEFNIYFHHRNTTLVNFWQFIHYWHWKKGLTILAKDVILHTNDHLPNSEKDHVFELHNTKTLQINYKPSWYSALQIILF